MDEKESMMKVAEKIKELQAIAKKKKNMLVQVHDHPE